MLATSVDAIGYPRLVYMAWVRRGKHAAKMLLEKPCAACALAEYVSYASAR